tara:strand:+ start:510 stop:683 length:174 start_codon:yes stop_codon:yes gene_type:complete
MKLELQRNERIKETGGHCANCGRPAHENPLWEINLDGDNKPINIKVCDFYRPHKKED